MRSLRFRYRLSALLLLVLAPLSLSLTQTDAQANPTILAIPEASFSVTSHSITLSWQPVPGASQYAIRHKRDDGSPPDDPYGYTLVTNVTETRHTITNLQPDTAYRVRLRAKPADSDTSRERSPWLTSTIRTLTIPTATPTHTPTPSATPTPQPLAAPTGLVFDGSSLCWLAVPHASDYRLAYPAHVTLSGVPILERDEQDRALRLCRALSGLRQGDPLAVQAYSNNPRFLDSPWSETIRLLSPPPTATATPSPTPTSAAPHRLPARLLKDCDAFLNLGDAAPTATLRASDVSNTGAIRDLVLVGQDGAHLWWRLEYFRAQDDMRHTHWLARACLTPLADNADTSGLPITRLPLEPPGNVRIVGTTLYWDAVDQARGYLIRWRAGSEDWQERIIQTAAIGAAGQLHYDLNDLLPPGEYTVELKARAGNSEEYADSAPSQQQRVTQVAPTAVPTPARTPLQTPNVSLQEAEGNTDATRVELSWTEVPDAAGYDLRLCSSTYTNCPDDTPVDMLSARKTGDTITDLEPGLAYTVQVRARPANDSQQYTHSEWSTITIPRALDTPGGAELGCT